MQKVLRIAHRGASGYEPEETLAAFSKAIDVGADVIELDVRVCKTGELVLIHDMTLERTTNGKGIVADMSLAELKRLDAGKGEKIPTLEETLDFIGRRKPVIIEMKGERVAERLAATLKNYIEDKRWLPDSFIVTSFDRKEFHRFSRVNPGVQLGILVGRDFLDLLIRARKYNAHSVHLPRPYMKRWFIRFLKKRGLKVFIYTLNSIWDIARAKVMGVDGIFSDYPDRV